MPREPRATVSFESETGRRWLNEDRKTGVIRGLMFRKEADCYRSECLFASDLRLLESAKDVAIEE